MIYVVGRWVSLCWQLDRRFNVGSQTRKWQNKKKM